MPDQRKHRGPHPKDEQLFDPLQLPKLSAAVSDLSWLLSKDYPEKASLKLVGDQYRLTTRQRKALMRSSCSIQAARVRQGKVLTPDDLKGKEVFIDAFNLIITTESALSGGFIFEGLDGCYRDLASIHGTYKRVEETAQAFNLIAQAVTELGIGAVHWLLDKPVSNSGRMKTLIYEFATDHELDWTAELYFNPDKELINCKEVVVTTDSLILDHCSMWFNLAAYLIERYIPIERLVRFLK
jgi:hypothetical protein